MFTALSTALSALGANATAVDVVGNNLANLNTTGFKQSSAVFHDLMSQTMGASGSTQIGFGVGTPATFRNFTQGALQPTSGPLDVAIQGDGFLVVRTGEGTVQYTRAGNFKLDAQGNLRTMTNEYVQGWSSVNGSLSTSGPIGNITVPVGSSKSPTATQNMSADINLDATAAITTTADPATYSTSIETFDSKGTSHVVNFEFWKTGVNTWEYKMSIPASEYTGATTGNTGTLTFDTNGHLVNPLPTGPSPNLQIAGLTSGASDLSIDWNLFNNEVARITNYDQISGSSTNSKDGNPAAQLTGVAIGDGGTIVGKYSDGSLTALGQLAMASIRNPDSLLGVGNNNYQLGAASANAVIGLPGSGGRGQILGGQLESSTVDIAREFTNLLVLQRSYQANARVVTSVDELSQETINLKR